MTTVEEILNYPFITIGEFTLNLYNLLAALLIFALARLLVFAISRVLKRIFIRQNVDAGRQFAVIQFLKYIIYTLTLLLALQAIGINLSLLWAGSAALLVGIGLGLQGLFLNLTSGVILLIDGSVSVGDILVVDNIVGRVSKIGIRTSQIETRDDISIVIPNSKLTTDNVVNWTYNQRPTRFQVQVGVSYNADIQLITKLLLNVAAQNSRVLKTPAPQVQFSDFGSSSLDFILHFYSTDLWNIEMIKSALRYAIMQAFREQAIEIPFPQRDLWLRNPEELPSVKP